MRDIWHHFYGHKKDPQSTFSGPTETMSRSLYIVHTIIFYDTIFDIHDKLIIKCFFNDSYEI